MPVATRIAHACTARTFGSVGAVMRANAERLAACPGIGPTKVKRLHETFHQPFRRVLRPHTAEQPRDAAADAASRAPGEPGPWVSGKPATVDGSGVAADTQPPLDGSSFDDSLEAAVALTQAVVEIAARGAEEDGEESDGVVDEDVEVM